MLCVPLLTILLLTFLGTPSSKAAPPPSSSSSSSSSTSTTTSFTAPNVDSCCLPRVWTATYHWAATNATGRVFVDYTQELFATREDNSHSRRRRRALNWRMTSRGGRHLHHSISSRKKRDVTYSRPVTSALELNRCMHRGRRQDAKGQAEMEFELIDDRLITGRSAQCKPLVHQHTSVRVTVDARSCQPKVIQFYTYSAGRRYTYYLPPPQFTLTNVRGYDDMLEVDVQRFLATDDSNEAGNSNSNGNDRNCHLQTNAFRPIMQAILAQRRRMATQRV